MIEQRDTYKFCTNCQAELKEEKAYKACPKCGKRYYFNPKPTVGIILTDADGKLLVTKRAYEPYKDWWDFPGGFVEEGETFEQAAQRELKEETGINVTDFTYVGSVIEDYHFLDELIPVVATIFSCKVPQQNILVTVNDDVSGYKFVTKEDLNLETIAFENQRAFVKDYLNRAN